MLKPGGEGPPWANTSVRVTGHIRGGGITLRHWRLHGRGRLSQNHGTGSGNTGKAGNTGRVGDTGPSIRHAVLAASLTIFACVIAAPASTEEDTFFARVPQPLAREVSETDALPPTQPTAATIGTATADVTTTASVAPEATRCDPAMSLAGRHLPIDVTSGPRFGGLQFPQTLPLAEKEVVLTFDDGPHPTRTPAILDTLDKYCVKAVFFVVGQMVMAHPDVVREVGRRGHLIGTHTYSHPYNILKMDSQRQAAEIDNGFAALAHVMGGPIAPMFRFPGLLHSPELLTSLSQRGISVWSVDLISGDSYFGARQISDRLFRDLGDNGRGIILMHDLKKATVEGLPGILRQLKEKGYTVPHVTVAPTLQPAEPLMAAIGTTRSPSPQTVSHQPQRQGGTQITDRSAPQPPRQEGRGFLESFIPQ